jgi:hypothetical protein
MRQSVRSSETGWRIEFNLSSIAFNWRLAFGLALFYSMKRSGHGGTGRRKGLKIPRSNPSGFESRCPHHHQLSGPARLKANKPHSQIIAFARSPNYVTGINLIGAFQ